MKKIFLAMATAVLLGFTACGNDGDDGETLAEHIAGTYNGYSNVTVGGKPYGDTHEGQSIKLTASADSRTIDLYFHDAEWVWGTYSLTGLGVNLSFPEGVYTLSGAGDDLYILPMSGIGDPVGPYSYTMTANIVSTTEAEFVFNLTIGATMPATVITFKTNDKL